jgi:hypothetical protein
LLIYHQQSPVLVGAHEKCLLQVHPALSYLLVPQVAMTQEKLWLTRLLIHYEMP